MNEYGGGQYWELSIKLIFQDGIWPSLTNITNTFMLNLTKKSENQKSCPFFCHIWLYFIVQQIIVLLYRLIVSVSRFNVIH